MSSSAPPSQFSLIDYLVLSIVLLISSAIGLYYRLSGGRQKTSSEYLLADGAMAVAPVAFSLMASFMSAITLLGVTQENYTYGTQFVAINFAYLIATPVATHIFLPVFYRLRAVSVYHYLELRFGRLTRLLASMAFSLQMVLYMGIVLYAPALALSAVTGLHFEGAVIGIGLVCTFYSTLGGMKAVLMTDLFQSLLMFAAVFSVAGCSLWDVHSFDLPDPTVEESEEAVLGVCCGGCEELPRAGVACGRWDWGVFEVPESNLFVAASNAESLALAPGGWVVFGVCAVGMTLDLEAGVVGSDFGPDWKMKILLSL